MSRMHRFGWQAKRRASTARRRLGRFSRGSSLVSLHLRRLHVEPLEDRLMLTTFTVNSTVDAVDQTIPGDGQVDASLSTPGDQVTLRAAIQEVNALFGDDTINLPAGNYRFSISLAGRGEDQAATGDLDIRNGNLTIIGAGRDTTIIDASDLDRVFHVFPGLSLSISGVTLIGGLSTGFASVADALGGGAIFNEGQLTLANSTLTNNTALGGNFSDTGGGAIWSSGSTSSVTIIDSILSGNSADADGGAINMPKGTLNISGSVLSGNSSNVGGAIFNGGNLTISDTVFSDNSGGNAGGGISNAGRFGSGSATITNSTFSGNSAFRGGAISNNFQASGNSILNVTGSTFSGNQAGVGVGLGARDGGGIHDNGGSLTINNSTFSGNSAPIGNGGGLGGFGTMAITSSTFTGNSAQNGGGISGDVTLTNTIVANNSASSAGPDISGTVSANFSLIEDTGGVTIIGSNNVTGDDPMLGPLQANGGPTLTHLPDQGSPAIDAGNNANAPATDQRGSARIVDGNGDGTATIDIGAVEVEVAADTTSPTIVDVQASGSGWGASFLSFLGASGFAIPVGNGEQLRALPWTGINEIHVVFSEEVVVAQGDLSLVGVNVPSYTITGLTTGPGPVVGTFLASWTLQSPIDIDKVRIDLPDTIQDLTGNALDGEWDNPTDLADPSSDTYPSGNTVAGGDFGFRFNVLPGDASGDGIVNAGDYTTWANHFGEPLDGDVIKADFNANGAVNAGDYTAWANKFGDNLPGGEPLGPVAASSEGLSLPLATAVNTDSADRAISAAASPSASSLLSATSSDVFFIRTPAPALFESPSSRTLEPVAVPVHSASASDALGQPLRRQQTVDAVFGQLTDRPSHARSNASRLRVTAEVWDLALGELFAGWPWDA